MLGALQVPADGRPVLFLADHPTTGGYPVLGVVHPDDVPLAAQARPGSRLRFRMVPARHFPRLVSSAGCRRGGTGWDY